MSECWINVWASSASDSLDECAHFPTRSAAAHAAGLVIELWGERLLYRLHITLKPVA